MPEKFFLKWNDFHSNVSKSFGLLRNEDYLHDVTLVSDDYKQVTAHKLVLSACSEYFKNIFKNNWQGPFQHQLICLSGVSSDDLENVLNYVYNGEVQIYQDDLDRFLEVAQRLKLDGLLATQENQDQEMNNVQNVQESYKMSEPEPRIFETMKTKPEKMTSSIERTLSINSADMSNINERINGHITRDDDKNFRCTLCGKTAKQKIQIQYHVETHMDGLEFPCQLCDKTFR